MKDPAGEAVAEHQEERELIAAVKVADLEAFETLFERYQPSLFRSVMYQMRDADAAHDIVQETFVRIWSHRTSLKPSLSFQALLNRISTNLVRDHFRHLDMRQRTIPDVPLPLPPAAADPAAAARHALLSEDLRRVMRDVLPDRCRAVFELSRLEGLTTAEVAERLQIRPKTVEHQLTKALRILKRSLRHHIPGLE
jgi:RNA polymerase sigma-70 factor (ECF subfamily)